MCVCVCVCVGVCWGSKMKKERRESRKNECHLERKPMTSQFFLPGFKKLTDVSLSGFLSCCLNVSVVCVMSC